MLHVRGGADRLLDGIDDALLDVDGRRALVDDPDEGDRHLDLREQIPGQAIQRDLPQHDHRERQHQDADAVAEREKGQPHTIRILKSGSCRLITLTCSRSAKGKQVALCSARVPCGATRKHTADIAGGGGVTASGRPDGAEGRTPESSGLRPGNVLSTSGLLGGRTPQPKATNIIVEARDSPARPSAWEQP